MIKYLKFIYFNNIDLYKFIKVQVKINKIRQIIFLKNKNQIKKIYKKELCI